jgi:hypothetical protein
MRSIAVIVVCAAIALIAARTKADQGVAASGEIDAATRAAGLTFGPTVAATDRAWIEAAIASARPEAQRLIGEVDGTIRIETDLPYGGPIGLAELSPRGTTVRFELRSLNGDRAIDREVVVLHELGHVIDYLLIADELVHELDAKIPRIDYCPQGSMVPMGGCSAIEERFADTFALGTGYGIPAPASIEDWGAPLGLLAARLSAR